MKKENDEITDLFRTRLADAGMAVRDGFWEELSQDIPVACQHRRRLIFFCVAGIGCILGYFLVFLSKGGDGGGIYQNRGGKQRKNGWRWGTCQSIADGNGTCIAETGT